MNQFLKLLRKDWRLNRGPMIALLFVIGGPYVLSGLTYYFGGRYLYSYDDFKYALEPGAIMGICLGAIIAAALGGAAFATERREKWADFLAMVPAPRWQVVLSKLLMGVAPLLLAVTFNVAMLAVLHVSPPSARDLKVLLGVLAGVYPCAFGLAWLFSSFLDSAAVAAGVSIGISCAALVGIPLYVWKATDFDLMLGSMAGAMGAAGLFAVIIGGIYYARRIAP